MGNRIQLHIDNCGQLFDKSGYNTQVFGWVQAIPTDSGVDMCNLVREWVQSGNSAKKMLRLQQIIVANR